MALALASCASGPTYAELKPTLPPLAKGHGRVFVYRPSSFGAAIQPSVKIDDQVVGTSEGRGFIYSDQPAGSRKVSLKTEWNHEGTVAVKSGEVSFVRCSVIPGVFAAHVRPSQVERSTGEEEIQDCKWSGK